LMGARRPTLCFSPSRQFYSFIYFTINYRYLFICLFFFFA